MNKQLKKFAEEAGFTYPEIDGRIGLGINRMKTIKNFAKLVHQAAMEESAKICDELNYNGMNSLHCAAAIRNRAEEYLKNE